MTPPIGLRTQSCIKYLGSRPKNDIDNKFREQLCHIVKDVGCFHEICPEKLYLVYLAKGEDISDFSERFRDGPFICWTTLDQPKLHYEPFNMDFGPYNLATTHHFCSRLKVWLDTRQYRNPDKCIVVALDDSDIDKKLNITLLVAIAAMVLLDLSDEEVLQRLSFFMMYNGSPGEISKQLVFREKKKFTDVSGNHSIMTVTLEDCIRAFYAALKLNFYNYYEFDHIEYLFYETVISGDLNWIVPGKLLAFAGPSDNTLSRYPPEFYYHYFKDHDVTTIIRLNNPEYKSATFKKLGFDHHDLIFPDGFPPTTSIAARFVKIVDEAKGAVAVHCYAGIGRTGTLIAAYLMARYNFTSQMAVAWTRICRPGSVIGEQQDWLFTKFNQYDLINKSAHSTPMDISTKTNKESESVSEGDTSSSQKDDDDSDISRDTKPPTSYAAAEKVYGQAKALVMTKKDRETSSAYRPRTRNQDKNQHQCKVTGQKSPRDHDLSCNTSVEPTPTDLVLDLGKTVPWSLYEEDIFPLKGNRNPETYRLYDDKYRWRVKFPESDYVVFRHNYDEEEDKSNRSIPKAQYEYICRVMIDFTYEDSEQTTNATKTFNKKAKSKPASATDNPLTSLNRLKPTVLYSLRHRSIQTKDNYCNKRKPPKNVKRLSSTKPECRK